MAEDPSNILENLAEHGGPKCGLGTAEAVIAEFRKDFHLAGSSGRLSHDDVIVTVLVLPFGRRSGQNATCGRSWLRLTRDTAP
jgi:hypothetical protein